MWERFKYTQLDSPETYEAWAFGDSKERADDLAALVVERIKTATASNYTLYKDDEELPYEGLHNIIVNGEGEAVAIVVTTSVEIVPFDEVTAEHAYLEGESDHTLEYWRKVHEEFFTREFDGTDYEFHKKIPVACERFEVVYT